MHSRFRNPGVATIVPLSSLNTIPAIVDEIEGFLIDVEILEHEGHFAVPLLVTGGSKNRRSPRGDSPCTFCNDPVMELVRRALSLSITFD